MAPTRECVELEGIPEYQVKMFQIIAPPSAAKITGNRASPAGRSISEETVSATAFPPVRAPRRLKHDASSKACLGFAALLVIKVATTALAEWTPLVTVKTRAKMSTPVKISSIIYTTCFSQLETRISQAVYRYNICLPEKVFQDH